MGFFYRTIRMVENGIKPVYVFDGKPPELKAGVVRGAHCPAVLVAMLTWHTALETVSSQGRGQRGGRRSEGDRSVGRLPTYFLCLMRLHLGTAEDVDRFARRTVKVTREHNEECRRLLGLMGIPFVVVRTSHYSRYHDLIACRHHRKQKRSVQS